MIQFDLHALQGRASVLDSVILTVEPAAGGVRRHAAAVANAQTEVAFDVRVPAGTTRFLAEVRSNTGVLLFSGEATEVIETNGFQVSVEVRPQVPVLVVTPDLVRMQPVAGTNFFRGEVTLSNVGVPGMRWTADNLPFPACQFTQSRPCIDLDPVAGTLSAGFEPVSIHIVVDSFGSLPAQGVLLRFTCRVDATVVGFVDVRLAPQ